MTDDENPVEIRTALALAKLWDDPKNNHFKTMKEHWKHDLPDTPSRTSRLIKKHGVEGAEIILDEEEREEVEEEKERGDAEADEG